MNKTTDCIGILNVQYWNGVWAFKWVIKVKHPIVGPSPVIGFCRSHFYTNSVSDKLKVTF